MSGVQPIPGICPSPDHFEGGGNHADFESFDCHVSPSLVARGTPFSMLERQANNSRLWSCGSHDEDLFGRLYWGLQEGVEGEGPIGPLTPPPKDVFSSVSDSRDHIPEEGVSETKTGMTDSASAISEECEYWSFIENKNTVISPIILSGPVKRERSWDETELFSLIPDTSSSQYTPSEKRKREREEMTMSVDREAEYFSPKRVALQAGDDCPVAEAAFISPQRGDLPSKTRKGIPRAPEWSTTEIQILKDNAHLGAKKICSLNLLPGRAERSVRTRMNLLRLYSVGPATEWSTEEKKAILSHLWLTPEEIVKKKLVPRRTKLAIQGFRDRLYQHAEKKMPKIPFTPEEISIVRANVRKRLSRIVEQGVLPGRTEDEIHNEMIRQYLPPSITFWSEEEKEKLRPFVGLPRTEAVRTILSQGILVNRSEASIKKELHVMQYGRKSRKKDKS